MVPADGDPPPHTHTHPTLPYLIKTLQGCGVISVTDGPPGEPASSSPDVELEETSCFQHSAVGVMGF